jgi:hypothetical protein
MTDLLTEIARIIAMGRSGNQPDRVTAQQILDAVRKAQGSGGE